MESRVQIGTGGRVVLPAKFRRALGLKPGDELVLVLDDGGLKLLTVAEAVRRAQALVGRYVPREKSLASELVAQRQEEAQDE